MPTILDSCGLKLPTVFNGVDQYPLSGVSMRYTFDARPDAPTQEEAPVLRHARHPRHLAGWLEGRGRARPDHRQGALRPGPWELYHVDADRAESKDLAKENPEKLKALIKSGSTRPTRTIVLPLDDRTALELLGLERPAEEAPRERYIYFPGTAPVPEGVAVNIRGRSYKILADVEIKDPECAGVIFAHGSRFGGHALFIKDKKLHYVYNFLGIKPEQQFVSPELEARQVHARHGVLPGERRRVRESLGTDEALRQRQGRGRRPDAHPDRATSALGDGLCVGYDSGDPVSQDYKTPGEFKGGTILGVGVTTEKAQYLDLEKEAAGAFARD